MSKEIYVTLNETEDGMIILESVKTITDPNVYKPIENIVNMANGDTIIPITNILMPILPYMGKKFKDRYYLYFEKKLEILKEVNISFDEAIDRALANIFSQDAEETQENTED